MVFAGHTEIECTCSWTMVVTAIFAENKQTGLHAASLVAIAHSMRFLFFQVDIESTVEHPYYIYGRGWASCSPGRTLTCYGLMCQRLQVGDVCVSLSPRLPQPSSTDSMPPPTAPPSSQDSQDPEDKAGKRRRWSAPEQIDVDDEIIDPGSPSPVPTRLKQ